MDLKRTHVVLKSEYVENVSSIDYPQLHGTSDDLGWSKEKFADALRVEIGSMDGNDMEFDLVGIDASLANAFRRILIAEVPTIAIDKLWIHDYDNVMAEEVFAHRLGLIPLKVDARLFKMKESADEPDTDENTVKFELQVECTANAEARKDEVDPSLKFINHEVKSGHLQWISCSDDQTTKFLDNPIRPVTDSIVLTKMRPGQRIHATMHCYKGLGKEHAKWSPVATASYRLLPEIRLLQPITGPDALKLQQCFPPGTIGIRNDTAFVNNPRKDTASREALRHDEFKDKVLLTRVRDHFIFSIESTGCQPPETLFEMAADVLVQKCALVKEALIDLRLLPESSR